MWAVKNFSGKNGTTIFRALAPKTKAVCPHVAATHKTNTVFRRSLTTVFEQQTLRGVE
jgi:hypothetical protein